MRSVVVFALLGLCWYELHTCVHANDAKKNIRKRKLKPSRRLSAYCDCYGVNECNDECEDSNNGVCDDDGSCDVCVPGTDKTDCEKEGGTECSTSSSSSSSSSGGSNYAGYEYGFDDSTAAKEAYKKKLIEEYAEGYGESSTSSCSDGDVDDGSAKEDLTNNLYDPNNPYGTPANENKAENKENTLWENIEESIEYVFGVSFGACCTCGGIFAYCKKKAQQEAENAMQDPHKWLSDKREQAKLLQGAGIEMKEIRSRHSLQIKKLKTNHATQLADLEKRFKGASDKKYDEIMERIKQLKKEHADKLKEVNQEHKKENIEFMKENAEKGKELAGIAGSIGVPGIEMGEMTSVLGAGRMSSSFNAATAVLDSAEIARNMKEQQQNKEMAVIEIVEEAPVYISQAEYKEQEEHRRRLEESMQEWNFKIEVKNSFLSHTFNKDARSTKILFNIFSFLNFFFFRNTILMHLIGYQRVRSMLARNLSSRKRLQKYLEKVDKDENGYICGKEFGKLLVKIKKKNHDDSWELTAKIAGVTWAAALKSEGGGDAHLDSNELRFESLRNWIFPGPALDNSIRNWGQ